jgi:hypothetical protein
LRIGARVTPRLNSFRTRRRTSSEPNQDLPRSTADGLQSGNPDAEVKETLVGRLPLTVVPLQLLEQTLDGRQARLHLCVLGLHPVDVGVQRLDLARGDIRAGEVVEGGSQSAGFLLQHSERAADQRQAVELGANGSHFGVQAGHFGVQAGNVGLQVAKLGAERSEFCAQDFEREIGHTRNDTMSAAG